LKRSCIGTFSLPGESYRTGVQEKHRGDNNIEAIISDPYFANLFALGRLTDAEWQDVNFCLFGRKIQPITRCLLWQILITGILALTLDPPCSFL